MGFLGLLLLSSPLITTASGVCGFSLHGPKTFKTEIGFVGIREYSDVIVQQGLLLVKTEQFLLEQ